MKRSIVAAPIFLVVLSACGGSDGVIVIEDDGGPAEPSSGPASDAGGTSDAGARDGATSEDGGGSKDAGVDAQVGDGMLRVFVSTWTYPADFGGQGIANADGDCRSEAETAGLPGTFTAFLGVSGTPAASRLKGKGPWYLVDGDGGVGPKVFDDVRQMQQKPYVAINRDARAYPQSGYVWTGTSLGGQQGFRCLDWASIAQSQQATWGTTSIDEWTETTNQGSPIVTTCDQEAHIYCFQN